MTPLQNEMKFPVAGAPSGSPMPSNSAGGCPKLVIQMLNCEQFVFICVVINPTGMEILVVFGIVFL